MKSLGSKLIDLGGGGGERREKNWTDYGQFKVLLRWSQNRRYRLKQTLVNLSYSSEFMRHHYS